MLYRYKVGIFAGIVASITFLLVYITGPKSVKGPELRVLYISFSDHEAVKRSLGTTILNPDRSVQALKISENGTVTIDREELDLKSTTEEFYRSNVVLECTASFPIVWKYTGYGDPDVTEKNIRIHGDFNDSSTFTYLSVLNLMPLTEKSTGGYSCVGISTDKADFVASVHLFVPGSTTFLIDYDTSIDSTGGEDVFVPCPVSNASASISLYFKNQAIPPDINLLWFNPKTGFYLRPKFTEQTDPWGPFYCKNEETKEKSGTVTIQPVKGLLVKVHPEGETVQLSTSNGELKDTLTFMCQAKEEITLKFLKVVSNPMVQYDYNASSTFPFSAFSDVSTRKLRNMSRIYCRTVRGNQDLHLWKIIFSSLSMRNELMDFRYDTSREDFVCCSTSNKRAKLSLLNCNSISECGIKGKCLLPGRKCDPDKISSLPERAGCVRHKLGKDDKTSSDGSSDLQIQSGLLQCSIDGKNVERVFYSSRYNSANGSHTATVSGDINLSPKGSSCSLDITADSHDKLQIIEMPMSTVSKRRFFCKGAKFFLAAGFIWQSVYTNKRINYHTGRDTIKGMWIQSHLSLDLDVRESSTIKRIYCIAPVWDSDGDWVNVKLDLYA
ncbi:unnamed protein product [Orchesella dallaii]|uniref:Ig-like domain-containing protein n=1 Tax=Orchesella dallaii TaxID=48710 RepID=A0ABP1Q828_9HEXA